MASAFFSVLFVVDFIICLLLFWIAIMHRTIEENGKKESKTLNIYKIIYSIVLWIFIMITYIGFSELHLNDPGTSFDESFGGFYEVCKIFGLVLFTLYCFWLLYYYVKFF